MEDECQDIVHDVTSARDPDLELLDAHLDGELTPEQIVRLEQRLAHEPALSEALTRLSLDYTVRRAVWREMEPTEPASHDSTRRIVRAARRADLRRRARFLARFAAAAVVCLGVGFFAGWIGRGSTVARAADEHPTTAVHTEKHQSAYVYQVALTDDAGNITAIQKFDTLEAAKNFAADVARLQAHPAQNQYPPSPIHSSGL